MGPSLPSCRADGACEFFSSVPGMAQLRDVAIIGAGLLGLAAGRALAARGRDVVVLEQAEIGHQAAGSKGSCRIFRLGYPEPAYVSAARQAGELWRGLEVASGRRILLPTAQLTFGTGLRAVHDAMQAAGAPCELLPAMEVAARFPAVRVGGPALLEPDSCVIAADTALEVLAAAVPEIRTGVRVLRLTDDGSRVTVRTSAGTVTARTVVITAGPWSGGLLATLGVPLPGRPTQEQVAYLRPAGQAAAAPIFICHADRAPYGLPVPGSPLYKIGIHPCGPATDPDAQDQSADPRLVSQLSDVAKRYLPGFDPEPAATERCVYDNSPDEDFVVDRTGNVVVGSGTSGHGFKFGPLFGEWLADLATGAPGGPVPELRQRFALDRFRH
jgi:sarcosine oxidase